MNKMRQDYITEITESLYIWVISDGLSKVVTFELRLE